MTPIRTGIRSIAARLAALVAGLLVVPVLAHAQAADWPNRPIRLVVPYAAGGGTDVLARAIAQKLTERLGQSVIVENRPGADGVIGSEHVARSQADGYTMLLVSSSHAINPTLVARMPFDTLRDLSCVTTTAAQQVILVVHPSLPVKTVAELIDYARQRPNELSFGSPSKATQLPMELFNAMAGTKMINVPYKGSGPALIDMLAGRVPVGFGGEAAVMPHVKTGKLRALAIGDDQRTRTHPELPTVSEAGLPGFRVVLWSALLMPARTPRPIVQHLANEISAALKTPEFRGKLEENGFGPIGNSPEVCDRFIESEVAKWAKVSKDAGLQPE